VNAASGRILNVIPVIVKKLIALDPFLKIYMLQAIISKTNDSFSCQILGLDEWLKAHEEFSLWK